nr:hypothetical protein [Candidatus Omnitrophota bacterium]
MNKKQLIVISIILSYLFPVLAHAVTYDDILVHKASDSRPFLGDHYEYKNIKWISHKPYFEGATDEQMKEMEQEMLEAVDERGQIDVGSVDFDGNGENEYLKARWTGYGGPAKGLIIEVYQDKELKNQIGFVNPQRKGYHPNFKVEDVDKDGSLELITFAGVPDPNMSSMYGDVKPFEPRFADRFLNVSIYKFTNGTLELSRQYLTKDKYEPHYIPDEGVLSK